MSHSNSAHGYCNILKDDRDILSQFCSKFTVINPWGVGKWLGQRGKLLSQLIAEFENNFFLGDNGGRPSLWSWIPQFSSSQYNKFNGSDPLPIDGELDRVASYGVALDLDESELRLENLLKALKLAEHQNYGKPMGLRRFIQGRIAMSRRPKN